MHLNVIKDKELLNNLSNHFIIVYFFTLPWVGPSEIPFLILLILFFLEGNILYKIAEQLKNSVVLAFVLYFSVHILWSNFSKVYESFHVVEHLLYPIVFLSIIKKEYIYRVFQAFILGVLVSEITSYLIFFKQIKPFLANIHGTIIDPTPYMLHTSYGVLLAYTSGLLLFNFLQKRKKSIFSDIFSVLFFLTISINIMINGGRTGYILYGVSLFIVLIYFRKIKFLLTCFAFVMLSYLLAYNYSANFQARTQETISEIKSFSTDDAFKSSTGNRIGAVYFSSKVIKEHLFFGVGTSNQLPLVREKMKEGGAEYLWSLPHMHNENVISLLQFGIIGFLFYLNIYYRIIQFEQNNLFLRMNMVLIASLLFIFSFIDSIFYTHMYVIFIPLLTLSLVSFKKDEMIPEIPFKFKHLVVYTGIVLLSLFIHWIQH